jgi:hypothetical protein
MHANIPKSQIFLQELGSRASNRQTMILSMHGQQGIVAMETTSVDGGDVNRSDVPIPPTAPAPLECPCLASMPAPSDFAACQGLARMCPNGQNRKVLTVNWRETFAHFNKRGDTQPEKSAAFFMSLSP